MENAHTLTEPAAAPGNPLMARMKAIAEALLDAFEAVPVPKDYVGIGKAARTLISLDRLIKALWSEGSASRRRKPVDLPEIEAIAAESEMRPAQPLVLNRQQRRREEKLRRVAKIPERTAFAMSP